MATEDKNGAGLVPRDKAALSTRSADLIGRGLAALSGYEPEILRASCDLTAFSHAARRLLNLIEPIDPENDLFDEYVEIEACDGQVFLRAPGEFLRAQIDVEATVEAEGIVTLDLDQFPSLVTELERADGGAGSLRSAYLPPVATPFELTDDPDSRERSELDVILWQTLQRNLQDAGNDDDAQLEAWKSYVGPWTQNPNARLEIVGTGTSASKLVSTRRDRAEWGRESSRRVWGPPTTWRINGSDLERLVRETSIREIDESEWRSGSLSRYMFVDLKADSVGVVATNGRLAVKAEAPASGDSDLHVLLLADSFRTVVASLDSTGDVEITTAEFYSQLMLHGGDCQIELFRFEHDWRNVPDVRQVLPVTVLEEGIADRSRLIADTEKMMEQGATQIMLLVSEGRAAVFGPWSLVEFDLGALAQRLLVNPALLLEILHKAPESELAVQVCPMPPTAAVECDVLVIRTADSANRWLGMLMPLRQTAQDEGAAAV